MKEQLTNTNEIVKEKLKYYEELKKINKENEIKKEKLYPTVPYYMDFFILFYLTAFFGPFVMIILSILFK